MKITTDELCRRSGVSPSTVLRTLNGIAISESKRSCPPGKSRIITLMVTHISVLFPRSYLWS